MELRRDDGRGVLAGRLKSSGRPGLQIFAQQPQERARFLEDQNGLVEQILGRGMVFQPDFREQDDLLSALDDEADMRQPLDPAQDGQQGAAPLGCLGGVGHMADIGRKGGESVSQDSEHMSEIGRKGGESGGRSSGGGGSRGGSSEQHAKAGRQSHKNR